MVAYQGQVQFQQEKSGSMAKLAKKIFTSEDVSLMRVTGQGEVRFADDAGYVFLLELENEGLSAHFRTLLAFASSLPWDITRPQGARMMTAGLFNTTDSSEARQV